MCKPGSVGDAGQCWTVPIFILNSHNNGQIQSDEDIVPQGANPHPLPGEFNQDHQDFSQNVQDIHEVDQANIDEGWVLPDQVPNAAAATNLHGGWPEWPQRQGEVVNQNELNQIFQ